MEQTNTKVVEYQVCCAMTLYIHIMCVAQISICMYGMPHDIYIYGWIYGSAPHSSVRRGLGHGPALLPMSLVGRGRTRELYIYGPLEHTPTKMRV